MERERMEEQITGQFRAALAMLKKAVELCPEPLWTEGGHVNPYWHVAYHAIFYTHLYLHDSEEEFRTRAGGHLLDLGPTPWFPGKPDKEAEPYTREQILSYIELCRREVSAKVAGCALDAASGFSWLRFDRLGVHLYNLRHLQHHVGQLADRLRVSADISLPWERVG